MSRIAHDLSSASDGLHVPAVAVPLQRTRAAKIRSKIASSQVSSYSDPSSSSSSVMVESVSINRSIYSASVLYSGRDWGGANPTFPTARPGPLAVSAKSTIQRDSLAPYLRKYSRFTPPSAEMKELLRIDYINESLHGQDGPVSVTIPDIYGPFQAAWVKATHKLGWCNTDDPIEGEKLGTFACGLRIDA
jgi:choline dehydrogenase-like flavoprotein